MTMNGDKTPPHGFQATRLVARDAYEGQRQAHERIDSLDEGFGRVLGAIAALERRTNAGFERMGELIDEVVQRQAREHRRTEDSHHDLSEELARTKRIATMKTVTWPTAIVISVMIACYCTLLALHVEMPTWLVGGVGVIGAAIAGALPALLGTKAPQ